MNRGERPLELFRNAVGAAVLAMALGAVSVLIAQEPASPKAEGERYGERARIFRFRVFHAL